MALDAKKHVTFAAGEVPKRSVSGGAGLAESIFSINDVVPVANLTEAVQVATAVVAAGQNLATTPLFVSRADARGLHRIEYTYNGTDFLPASGRPQFSNKAAADTFGTSFSTLLTVGDRCVAAGVEYRWSGTAWVGLSARMKRSTTALNVTNATINQDLSLNTYWLQDWLDAGIATYNNGWTIPFAGEWEIDFGAKFASGGDLVITVNKSSIASVADFAGYASAPTGPQSFALIAGRHRLRLAAGDVIRLFGASSTTTPGAAWDTTAAVSWFGIRYVGF